MVENSDINHEISLQNAESIKELKKSFFSQKKNKIKCSKTRIILLIIICIFLISGLLLLLFQKQFIKIIRSFIDKKKKATIKLKQIDINLEKNETKIDNETKYNYTKENKTQESENVTQLYTDNNTIKINESIKYDKWKDDKLVIHALGKFNNTVYANSYEGLNYYYVVKKMKLMEADFLLTNDGHIVTAHDFKLFNNLAPSLDKFKKSRIKGNLTPMTFEDLVKYMYENKDLYIITDTKYSDITRIEKEFNEMTEILSRYGNVNERFIIEIYNERMYEFIRSKKYPFNHFLFTLYQRLKYPYNFDIMENMFKYCREKGIDGIIMWNTWFNDKVSNFSKKYYIPVYLHTVNNIEEIVELLNQGAKAIFTDNVTYDILEKYLEKKNYRLLSFYNI